jgi:hypothetical protein
MDVRLSWLVTGGVAVLLLWLAFSLSSGGGSGSQPGTAGGNAPGAFPSAGDGQAADKSSIEELIRRTSTQNDPKQCTDDMTPAFLRSSFGAEKGTLDRCRRRNTPQTEPMAKTVTIESVTGRGSNATAVFSMTSSNTLDGSVYTVSLVRQGGHWKLDSLDDIKIDRARFDQHLRDELGARGYLPAETRCAIAKLDRSVSSDQIERNVINNDSSYEYIEASAVSCLSRPTLLRELSQEFTAAFNSRGMPPRVTRCVVDRLTRGVPVGRLRHLLAAGSHSAESWWRLGYQAVTACLHGGPAGAAESATT